MSYKFNEAKHVHLLDEIPLYGTTTVIKEVMPPFLAKWGAQCAADWLKENPEDFTGAVSAWAKVREKAADKGTDMHAELEKYVNACISTNAGVPHLIPTEDAVGQFSAWAMENVDKFIFAEKYVYSEKLWTGGIVDCLASLKSGEIALVDFKSSKEAYFNQIVQAGGYALQLAENGAHEADGTPFDAPKEVQTLIIFPFGAKTMEPKIIKAVSEYSRNFEIVVELYKSLSNYSKANVWKKSR